MMGRRNLLKCLMAFPVADLVGAKAEASTMFEDGLVTVASKFSVKETIDRLEANLKAKDITVFARIDHAAGAASVAMPLRPTELLIFGNPKAGTPLMQSNQTPAERSGLPITIRPGLLSGIASERARTRALTR
jgi:hypothetical protein